MLSILDNGKYQKPQIFYKVITETMTGYGGKIVVKRNIIYTFFKKNTKI